jgi:uncharacterized protein (DUF488 family)
MIFTYGHGTQTAEHTAAVLRAAAIGLVIDVRIAPGSARNPQFARTELERWLPAAGIGYRWEKRLGGFRKPSAGNPDTAWRVATFRGYAEYMRGAEFLAAISPILAQAASAGAPAVAVMCSESSWRHCHRRLVSDFAQVGRGVPVRHLAHDGTLEDHQPSEGVRRRPEDGLLVYDGGQPTLI